MPIQTKIEAPSDFNEQWISLKTKNPDACEKDLVLPLAVLNTPSQSILGKETSLAEIVLPTALQKKLSKELHKEIKNLNDWALAEGIKDTFKNNSAFDSIKLDTLAAVAAAPVSSETSSAEVSLEIGAGVDYVTYFMWTSDGKYSGLEIVKLVGENYFNCTFESEDEDYLNPSFQPLPDSEMQALMKENKDLPRSAVHLVALSFFSQGALKFAKTQGASDWGIAKGGVKETHETKEEELSLDYLDGYYAVISGVPVQVSESEKQGDISEFLKAMDRSAFYIRPHLSGSSDAEPKTLERLPPENKV